jgi:hypothetical protein
MTTIPTHNIILQQSVTAHDAIHHNKPLQPDPGQVAAQHAVEEVMENTTVQESDEYEKLHSDKKKSGLKFQKRKKKKKKKKLSKEEQSPDTPGSLLDTVA